MTFTKDDFDALKDLIKLTIEEQTEKVLATKEDIKNLPTKEEFFSKMAEMMGELKTVREEITVLSDLQTQVHDHEYRIEKAENKLHIQAPI